MSRIKAASKDTLIYGVGMSLQKVIGFLLLPFYTRALSPAEYGVLSTISVLIFFVSTILGFGLDGATSRYFFKVKVIDEQKKVLSTSLVLNLILNIPIILLACLFAPQISNVLFGSQQYESAVLIALLLIPIQAINKLQNIMYRYFRKVWQFAWMSSIRAIVFPCLGILFVVYLKWSVFGAQLATFITTIILVIYSYFIISKPLLKIKLYDKKYAVQLLKFGAPLIFAGIVSWVNSVSDRFFLLHYCDLSNVGLYSIASSFSQPIQLFNTALSMGVGILILSSFEKEKDPNKPETKKFQTEVWHIYLYIGVVVSVVLSLFSIELAQLATTPQYVPAMVALPWLLLSHILVYSTQLTGNGMTLMMNSKPYPIMLTSAALLNVGLNFYFIPKWGFLGAAITTVISNLFYFLFAYLWSQRVYHIERSLLKPLFLLLFLFALSISIVYFQINEIYQLSYVYKSIIISLVIILPLFSRKNRVLFANFINKFVK
ncbi:MAG: oligosaccharide flippase family protein [Pleomorphochaeta sp.]